MINKNVEPTKKEKSDEIKELKKPLFFETEQFREFVTNRQHNSERIEDNACYDENKSS
jgi:hypothetical protein